MTILVVDDEAMMRNLLYEVLSSCGHRVDAAADGLEALTHLRSRDYDLIVTDIEMPVLDGITLWRRATDDGHPGRWIMMTGSGADLSMVRGRIPILRKPFEMDELEGLIERTPLA